MSRNDYILIKHVEDHTLLCMLGNGSMISVPIDLDVLLGVKASEFVQRRAEPVRTQRTHCKMRQLIYEETTVAHPCAHCHYAV